MYHPLPSLSRARSLPACPTLTPGSDLVAMGFRLKGSVCDA